MSTAAPVSSSSSTSSAAAASAAAPAGDAGLSPGCCVNAACARPLPPATRYCPYCAAEQPVAERSDGGTNGSRPVAASPDAARTALVLRAGEDIWHFEEDEGAVFPGQKRALLVVDEHVVHLAETARRLTPEVLLERVQRMLQAQNVPVRARLLAARWQNDRAGEARPRIVASLDGGPSREGVEGGHAYSDVQLLLGVDYLGGWASVHMNLAIEPEPLPFPPAAPPKAPVGVPIGPLLLLIVAGLALCYGLCLYGGVGGYGRSQEGTLFLALGSVLGVTGALGMAAERKKRAQAIEAAHQRMLEAWHAEQRRQAGEKQRERLSRTFKVDDLRLFATAMREVFQKVVDDIVEAGGTVVRVEGGHGGFFSENGLTQAAPAPRRADAADATV